MKARVAFPSLLFFGALIWSHLFDAAAAPPLDVDAVLRHLDDLYRSSSSISRVEISVTGGKTTRNLRIKAWTRGEDKSLIVIESPPREEGIATLRVGDNLWNYFPKISRTIRIPPSMMLASWMGTDFTNDDLVKESSYRKDFTSILGEHSRSPEGWWIHGKVKPGVVGRWDRIDFLVSDDGKIPIQMKYFDRRDRLARIIDFDEVSVMGGRRIPVRMILIPQDGEGKRTQMRHLSIEFNANVPDDTFSLSRLEEAR